MKKNYLSIALHNRGYNYQVREEMPEEEEYASLGHPVRIEYDNDEDLEPVLFLNDMTHMKRDLDYYMGQTD